MERGVWLHLETSEGSELLRDPQSLWADLAASFGQPFGAFPRGSHDAQLAERLESHAQAQVRSILAHAERVERVKRRGAEAGAASPATPSTTTSRPSSWSGCRRSIPLVGATGRMAIGGNLRHGLRMGGMQS